jgi:hypothetical protein
VSIATIKNDLKEHRQILQLVLYNRFIIFCTIILLFLSLLVPADRFGVSTATVIYNTQHSPYIFEELPPSYDSLTDIKKHPHDRPTNTNEEFQLTVLPNTTLTNTNDEVTSAAILPTAPTPPPPFYIDLNESN